jgi:hypothetical protein
MKLTLKRIFPTLFMKMAELDWKAFERCSDDLRIRIDVLRTSFYSLGNRKRDLERLLRQVNEYVVYLENGLPSLEIKYTKNRDSFLLEDKILRKELQYSNLDPALKVKLEVVSEFPFFHFRIIHRKETRSIDSCIPKDRRL